MNAPKDFHTVHYSGQADISRCPHTHTHTHTLQVSLENLADVLMNERLTAVLPDGLHVAA
eukprot:4432608-Amphidinium_carterae.3